MNIKFFWKIKSIIISRLYNQICRAGNRIRMNLVLFLGLYRLFLLFGAKCLTKDIHVSSFLKTTKQKKGSLKREQ